MFFNPNGSLNIASDASDLPDNGLTRAKNVTLSRDGISKVRKGSEKINSAAIGTVNHVIVQAGERFTFGTSVYKDESSIGSGYSSGEWSSVSYNSYNETTKQIYATNGTDLIRIESGTIYNWGIDSPSTDPISYTTNSKSGITGIYSIKYTYAVKSDSVITEESDPSNASNTVYLSGQGIESDIPWPTESKVTHVRAYRTTANGEIYYLDDDIAVTPRSSNQTAYTYDWESDDGYVSGYKLSDEDTTNSREYLHEWESNMGNGSISFMRTMFTWEGIRYCSDLSDGTLGTQVEKDNGAPSGGDFIAGPNYGGTLFLIKDNLLYYSKPRQPSIWPALYFIEVSTAEFPGVSMTFYNGQPYVLTKRHIYYIQGTGHNTFQPLDMRARTGCQGKNGVFTLDSHGIFHTGKDGIYLFSGGSDRKITKSALDPIFNGESVNDIPACDDQLITAWIIAFKGKLFFGYKSSGYTYPNNVIVMDIDEPRRVVYYSYPFEIIDICIDDLNDLLVAACGDGFARKLETGTQDDSTDISWEIQSKDFTLQTRRHFPRWAKYDVSGTATGEIILDDVSHQSHSITGTRDTKRRLIGVGNGNRCAIKLSGSGQATVYGVEFD